VAALWGVLSAAVVLWLYLTMAHSLPIEHVLAPDYTTLAIAHALNIDAWLERSPPRRMVEYFQVIHPGLPLQIVSWLVYRVVHADDGGDSRARFAALAAEPDRFLRGSQVACLLLTLTALCGLWTWARPLGRWVALTACILPFGYGDFREFALWRLGNETMAFPLALLAAATARPALMGLRFARLHAVAFGAACGIAYLNKLNYLAWPLAAACGFAVAWIVARGERPAALRGLGAFAAGFAVAVVGLGALLLGPEGLLAMLESHWAFFRHSGLYGKGATGVLSTQALAAALALLWLPSYRYGLLLVVALVVLSATGLAVQFRRPPHRRGEIALHAFLAAGVLLGFLAALKHFNPHYLVPPVALAAFLFARTATSLPRALAMGAAVVLVAAALISARFNLPDLHFERAEASAYRADHALIDALPLAAGEVRVWGYQTRTLPASLAFAVHMSGELWALDALDRRWPRDRYYNIWAEDNDVYRAAEVAALRARPWRYAIFSAQFPIPRIVREQGRERLRTDRLIVFENPHAGAGVPQADPHASAPARGGTRAEP
jgi:hypothetical protein